MNKNLTGVLYTAGAVVIGIVVATMVQQRLMKKKAGAMEDEAQYDICISENRLYPLHKNLVVEYAVAYSRTGK